MHSEDADEEDSDSIEDEEDKDFLNEFINEDI